MLDSDIIISNPTRTISFIPSIPSIEHKEYYYTLNWKKVLLLIAIVILVISSITGISYLGVLLTLKYISECFYEYCGIILAILDIYILQFMILIGSDILDNYSYWNEHEILNNN